MKLINGIKNIKSVIDRGRISRSGITYVEYSSVETHCMSIMFNKIEQRLGPTHHQYCISTVTIFMMMSLDGHMRIDLNPE